MSDCQHQLITAALIASLFAASVSTVGAVVAAIGAFKQVHKEALFIYFL